MPIISNFPTGGGSGGGLALAAVTGITTLAAAGKVYVKWTDPDDMVVAGSTLAAWGGTLLVRKAGSAPTSRRDGTIVLDSKTRDQYKSAYFCDSGLTNGVKYYYKLFPYTTTGTYTDSTDDEFNVTPTAVNIGNISGASAVAAGNGKLAIKWTDPAATVVSDGVTLATWASTKIVVKAGSYATSPDDSAAAYSLNVTTRNQYANSALTVTGLTNGTTYYISFFPISTDGAVNVNTSNRITGVPNRLTISTVPSQSGTLTYNKNSQSPSWSNYDTSKMTIGGTTSGTNASTYNATFTPKSDYCWSDGTTTAKTVSWKIGKATGTLTVSKTSVTVDKDNLTTTFTIGGNHDGTLSVKSNNTSIATVSLSGNTATVSHVNQTTGNTTITVSCGAGTNYTAPSNKTVDVIASFMPPMGNALDTYTWEQIAQISAAGKGDDYFDVGDRKGVLVNGTVGTLAVNATYYVYILGFAHNGASNTIDFGGFKSAASGGSDLCLTDGNYNSYSTNGSKYFNMNHWGNYNYGGWAGCDLRYDVLGSTNVAPSGYGSAVSSGRKGNDATSTCATSPVANTLMAALPSALRAVMKPMTIYTDNTAGGSDTASYVTKSVDYLPLLAEFEIFGSRSYANSAEKNYQKQYDYYKAGNSKIKYRHNSTSSTAGWWERSPYYGNGYYFCNVYTSGGADYNLARYSAGLAPAFRV